MRRRQRDPHTGLKCGEGRRDINSLRPLTFNRRRNREHVDTVEGHALLLCARGEACPTASAADGPRHSQLRPHCLGATHL